MLLKDEEARITAVENTNQNIIVEAGAGPGKTTLLVKKMLFLVFVKKVKLSRLVALTFTKKAAASLKQKLEENLYAAYYILLHNPFVLTAQESDFKEHLKEFSQEEQENFKKFRVLFLKSGLNLKDLFALLKTALEEVPLCQIGTIHSFCIFILKKYAVEAGLNTNVDIGEENYLDIIFDKYWALFLDEELNLTSTNKELWLKLLKEVSLNDLKNFARTLCTPRFENYTPKDNYQFLKQYAQKYLSDTKSLLKTYPKTRGFMTEFLNKTVESLEQSISFYNGKHTDLKEISFPNFPGSKPKNWEENDYLLAQKIANFTLKNISQKQELLLNAYSLLKPFVLQVQKNIAKQNYLTFDEIIFKTHHLLLTNKAVRQELKLSYDNIFIDEFQDTDPIQGEIMLFLAEDFDNFANTWQMLKLKPGKLFIVGDPKQSIYHFRGADISAYQEFCNLLKSQGAIICVLQNNFRSAKKIIDYVNAFGQNQIVFKENLQAKYQEIYPSKIFNNARVEMYLYDLEENAKKPDLRPMFAQSIAKWIGDNVKKTKKDDGTILDYKDIAILLPTLSDLNIFLTALKNNNIPYNVEEDHNFYSAQEILDLINILKVLKDPKDEIALIGILRSPIGLISDDTLLNLSKQNKLNIYAETEDKRIKNIYSKLKTLKEKTAVLNPLELINEILKTFNFTSYQTLASLNEQSLANISKLKQVSEKLFQNGSYTLEQMLDNFETYQKEEGEESSAILAEEDFNVIKILTIHKAKGLEYPVIILTDLSRNFSSADPRKKKQNTGFYSRNLNLKALSLGKIQDGVLPLIKDEKDAKEAEEKRRLLYVAMTRAKEALIIVDDINVQKGTYSNFLKAAGCWPSKENQEKELLSAQIFYQKTTLPDIDFNLHETKNAETVFDYPTWKENFEIRERDYQNYLQNIAKGPAKENIAFLPEAAEYAVKVGALCHKILQNIFSNTPINLEEETDKTALEEAKKIIGDFCKTPVFEELKQLECLATELPITILENGLVKNGIIDALFKTKEGKIKIIDFKSDKINIVSAKTVEPRYLQQLAFYKKALGEIFKENIESYLVYLRPAIIYKTEE